LSVSDSAIVTNKCLVNKILWKNVKDTVIAQKASSAAGQSNEHADTATGTAADRRMSNSQLAKEWRAE